MNRTPGVRRGRLVALTVSGAMVASCGGADPSTLPTDSRTGDLDDAPSVTALVEHDHATGCVFLTVDAPDLDIDGDELTGLWPPGASIDREGEVVEILTDEGEVIARDGERTRFLGSAGAPHLLDRWTIPGECRAEATPFWIVEPELADGR